MNDTERRRAEVARHHPNLLAAYDAAPDDVRDTMAWAADLLEEALGLGDAQLDLDAGEQRDAVCEVMGLLAAAAHGRAA
jgi:hypothetical protein